jgi:membrane fusion protein, copper/silver efflux system
MAIELSRNQRYLLAGACFLVALVAFVAGRATSPSHDGHADHASSHDPNHEHDRESIYYCSMHPDQQSTDPNATCPICGMDLIPMPDDGDPSEAGLPILRLSERSAALLRAEVAPVERRGGEHRLDVQGTVELDETRLADVVTRSDGFVERQFASYRWQQVRRGQQLASIYSPAITAAARELLVIQRSAAGRGSQITLESGKEKLRRLGAPEHYIQQVLDTGEVPRTYTLRSPVSGVLTEIEGREGQSMREGQRLVQIADLSRVWVQLQAYESDVRWLRVEQEAEIRAQAYPGRVFEARVAFIDPAVDPQRRTVRVRLEVENPDGALKPGMFVRGGVQGQPQSAGRAATAEEAPLVIPRSAPLLTGRRAVVYVQRRDGEQLVFEGRDVELGPRVGDVYEVLSGLEEGELVVTRGTFRIDSELQLRGRPSMMTPGEVFAGGASRPGAALVALDPDKVPAAFVTGTSELMERYFELTAALAADDLGRAQAAAVAMREALVAVPHGDLPRDADDAWGDVSLALTGSLAAMNAADDLEGVRKGLEPMAEPMERIAEVLAKVTGVAIYRGTCPMTPGGTGHWLQPDDSIANPYMGERMLACGTIAPVTP